MTKTQYQPTRWTLNDIIAAPEGPPVDNLLTELETITQAIETLRPKLTPEISGEEFTTACQLLEQFTEIAHRLGAYGQLWFTEDTQNQAALSFMGQMEQRLTEINNRILFFTLWWRSLDDETANRLLPHTGKSSYYFEQQRLFKDHTLPEPEEKIINLKNINGSNALITLYDMITNKFVFELEIDSQAKQLTRGELTTYVRHPSAELRAGAYQELYRVYQAEAPVLAQIYIHRVRDWASENLNLRHFEAPIAVRNRGNDVPDQVVDTLLAVCAEQASLFQRYFKLKAGWLGETKLRRYDLYAPLKKETAEKIPYGEAVEMVLDSFHQFSPQIASQAQRIFDENHIDAEVRPRKRSGAFCASVLPQLTPWILANYTGEPREVATLAHELGHAVHAMLAADHSVLTFHSALPMAETASVFAEMLLTDRLLAETTDPAGRRDLLAEAVDDAYATIIRQAYFVRFERDAHQMITEGQTMDQLNQHYLTNLNEQFGDSMTISDDFQYEWICIPHIYHTPFYCYAYSFGQLLALSLYQQYKHEGSSFTPKLLKILAYGGSASPNHILTEAGIDFTNPDFWRGGFKVVEGMIDELAQV